MKTKIFITAGILIFLLAGVMLVRAVNNNRPVRELEGAGDKLERLVLQQGKARFVSTGDNNYNILLRDKDNKEIALVGAVNIQEKTIELPYDGVYFLDIISKSNWEIKLYR